VSKMNAARQVVLLALAFLVGCSHSEPRSAGQAGSASVADNEASSPSQPLRQRIEPPDGYERFEVAPGSFGAWLRELPVRPGRPDVHLYDGRLKDNQLAHHAVLDIDVGVSDLQQCADAVIRLRAEYLFSGACSDDIRFNFTSGDTAHWKEWREGMRPIISGNDVSWERTAAADDSYSNFRRYLDIVFTYAGSASLENELQAVDDPARPEPGDIFIQGGFPGHAVIVLDVAEDGDGERIFLLAQSYMPAQDIHVLRSFEEINPWYLAQVDGALRTPEWEFEYRDLKRFNYTSCEVDEGSDNR